jgi:2-oxoglutarate dehydrogenase E2 component (dihydrolipoamide succinyltransferase)
MLIEIIVPGVGESVTEALLAQWFKSDGEVVKKEEPLFVIETDKVTLEVVAEADGSLSITVAEGETVAIGAVVGTIDTEAAAQSPLTAAVAETEKAEAAAPAPVAVTAGEKSAEAPSQKASPVSATDLPKPAVPGAGAVAETFAPTVRRLLSEHNLDPAQITGTGPAGRLTKGDVLLYLESRPVSAATGGTGEGLAAPQPAISLTREERVTRKPMSPIRQRIAVRLLAAKQNTAMLTTFNEIDMQPVMSLRNRYKEAFKQKHGVGLGFMSFFIKASIEALKEFSLINAYLDEKDIIEHHYYHIGIAVGSERGLVVPVIRHADQLNFAQLEQSLVGFVEKINANRLELSDLEGGTFTISNGGVYGSLLSTPILNMPQSAILGMHKIEKRPVVIDDAVVIRPMMYVALSYDHRIVDGRQAVGFLKRIKQCVEDPQRIMMEI